MSNDQLHEGIWVVIEDTYDRDRSRFGPFPDDESAFRFCDAWNSQSEKHEGTRAWCMGYDAPEKARTGVLRALFSPSIDAEAEARALGCKWEHEWMREEITRMKPEHCWCAALQEDRLPEANPEEIRTFLFKALRHHGDLFRTEQHYGDLSWLSCSLCGATVLKLLVECEGYGDSIHSYLTFPSRTEVEALDSGALGRASYEAFVENRCGIHKVGYDGTFYQRMKVGYLGLHPLWP